MTSIEEDNTYTGDDRTLATITRRNATDLSAGLVASVTQIVNRTAVYTEGSEGDISEFCPRQALKTGHAVNIVRIALTAVCHQR